MLKHGGNLYAEAQQYNIAITDWLDLSTGINPHGWPVPDDLPSSVWAQLPQDNDDLISTAQQYYQCDSLSAVAGSQAAIQMLPQLRAHSRVGILSPAYEEHAHAWQQAGHETIILDADTITSSLHSLDVLIIINPNNPTGDYFSPQQLLDWHQQLKQQDGWLIVDEAFVDVTPEYSLAHLCPKPNLIVLRSMGKFFGLAGLRVGFVLAEQALLQQLVELLGPWPIAHVSRYIAQQALADNEWQQQTITALPLHGKRLQQLLTGVGFNSSGDSPLFQWVKTNNAAQLHQDLAKQGILTRLFSAPSSIRFGLAKTEQEWQRLHTTLTDIL